MTNRKLITYFRKWKDEKDENDRKPLVLRGARQVGKTTLVNEFAKDFMVYLRLNMDKAANRQLFEDYGEINTGEHHYSPDIA